MASPLIDARSQLEQCVGRASGSDTFQVLDIFIYEYKE
jgi:hypothetical protein